MTTATIDPTATTRYFVNSVLDGKPPNGTLPNQCGPFAELVGEMLRAHQLGGKESARRIYVKYAEVDPAVAALRAADPEPRKKVWTTAELLAAQFPDPQWAVPGLVPSGLVMLAGRPKLGKSWLALSMAVAVGSGGQVLGRQVEPGKVLYLALEDNERRVQDRLRKQHAPPNADIDFRFEWRNLAEGGTADLMQAINENSYRLVVIDTISRALGRADQMDLGEMNVVMGSLQRMAVERNVCILPIDHHRKTASGIQDVIDDLMGSSGKTTVADAIMGLYRGRGERAATLKVTGRDVDEQELALTWDAQLFCWQSTGDAGAVQTESVQSDIMAAIEEMGGTSTVKRVADWLGKPKQNVHREMQELVTKGLLLRGKRDGKEVPYTIMATNDD